MEDKTLKCLRCAEKFTKEELWEFRDEVHENVVPKKEWVTELAKDWPYVQCPNCSGILVPGEEWEKRKRTIKEFNKEMRKARKEIDNTLRELYKEVNEK